MLFACLLYFLWWMELLLGKLHIVDSINPGEAYGLLGPHETECEYLSLTVGSRLSDAFSSYDESVIDLSDRLHHEYFSSNNMGASTFLHLISAEHSHSAHRRNEQINDNGVTVAGSVSSMAKEPSNIYHSMYNKWVYFLGDHSLIPIVRAITAATTRQNKALRFDQWLSENASK